MKLKLIAYACALVGSAAIAQDKELVVKPAESKKSAKLMSFGNDKGSGDITITNSTDSTYTKHTEFFSASKLDQYFNIKSSWTLIIKAQINEWIETKLAIKNKATVGSEVSVISTTDSGVKIGDGVTSGHRHYVAKLVPWIKEAWIDFSLNKAFGIEDSLSHHMKVGSFDFKLGRGISLGSAYAVSDGILGFYTSSVVDQYAFGSLIYGDIFKDKLSYNFYTSIIENGSDKFSQVNEPIYASEIGYRQKPQRGPGALNLVIASNLKWNVLDNSSELGSLTVEPYWMFNHAPEQKIEYPADASSRLATFGLATEFIGDRFEWGFDTAINAGSQTVRAWDRNLIQVSRGSDGVIKNIYSKVNSVSATGSKATVTSGVKSLVDASAQSASLNGVQIGTVDGVDYFNANDRFRAGYKNQYKGMMFVTDAAWCFWDKKLKLVGTFGWATGDEDPNANLENPKDSEVDGDYQGFVGLQELYSGKRVPALFVLGDYGAIRPMSSPTSEKLGFATKTKRFTNLVYTGFGYDWHTKCFGKGCRLKSNVLSYWQDKATKKYDATATDVTKRVLSTYASKHLGTEINTSMRVALIGDLATYFVAGVFVPGQHYTDIKGKPLDSAQLAALDAIDSTGFDDTNVPVIGTSTAIVLGWGLELTF